MKIRVPFAWYWFGEDQYGTPEVESGTIASTNPRPPRAVDPGRYPPGTPVPHDAGPIPEERLRQLEDQLIQGDDHARGGR